MVLLEFSMSPLGKGESVSPYVAESLMIIQASGLDYRLHAMGTVIEGEWDEVFAVVTRCFEKMKQTCPRITCTIKVDYREGASGRLDAKVQSVLDKVAAPLKTVERNTNE
jgi:uncharacterized protein (TIGR00106 family)